MTRIGIIIGGTRPTATASESPDGCTTSPLEQLQRRQALQAQPGDRSLGRDALGAQRIAHHSIEGMRPARRRYPSREGCAQIPRW